MDFLTLIQQAIESDTMIKITLSQPQPNEDQLKNIYARKIVLKQKNHLSFTYRYPKKDIVKNYVVEEGIALLETFLQNTFGLATLFTTEKDYIIRKNKKGNFAVHPTEKPSIKDKPSEVHDQVKNYLIPETAPFLYLLGITNKEGKVLAAQYDKYRQINKYIEIIDALWSETQPHSPCTIVDMGCGKGYLTFALYAFLHQKYPHTQVEMYGVELRADLVQKCNSIAVQLGYDQLKFVESSIEQYAARPLTMLIALHACDTATDMAIAKGIECQAQWIVTAPCCHRQLRKEMQAQPDMQPILKHGILEERQAEILTDGICAILLEGQGYKTAVFEFISNEHTAKNLMITAVRQKQIPNYADTLQRVQTIKMVYGIKTHFLETLLHPNH